MSTVSFNEFVSQGTGKMSDVQPVTQSNSNIVKNPTGPGLVSRIINKQADSLNQRADELNAADQRFGEGKQGAAETTVQKIGSGLAAYILDPIKNVVSETPGLKQGSEAFGKVVSWLANSDYSAVHELGKMIGSAPTIQKLTSLYDSDPSFKATVDATANIVSSAMAVKGGVDTGTAAINKTIDLLTPSKEIYAFHGTTPENAASIKENGFDMTKAKGGATQPKAVDLTTNEADAAHYAGGNSEGVLPVRFKGKNIATFQTSEEYINAVEKAVGDYSGPNATKFLNQYDGVVIKNAMSEGGDLVLTTNPSNLSIASAPVVSDAEAGSSITNAIKSKIKPNLPPETIKLNTAIEDATPNYESSTPSERQKLLFRVQEGGVLKGRSVKPNDLETEAGTELSKVPGYDPASTKLVKYQVTRQEIARQAQALDASLANEKVIVPKKEVGSIVRNAINQVPEESLLLQKSDPVIKNYIRVLNNGLGKVDGTLQGELDLRKLLDQTYENARGRNAFGSDKIAALDEIHTAARNSITQDLISRAQNVDVKTALRTQWNLYRALDELQVAAEKESGSSLGRIMQKYPITTRIVEKGAQAVGAGGAFGVIK